jgi:hypothetical protein
MMAKAANFQERKAYFTSLLTPNSRASSLHKILVISRSDSDVPANVRPGAIFGLNVQQRDFVYIPFNGRYKRVLFAIDKRGRLVGALYRAFEL